MAALASVPSNTFHISGLGTTAASPLPLIAILSAYISVVSQAVFIAAPTPEPVWAITKWFFHVTALPEPAESTGGKAVALAPL